MRKEEGWATGQQPVPVKLPTATEWTNKCKTAEKGKSSSSLETGSLILDPIFSPRNITRIGTWHVCTLDQTGSLAHLLHEFATTNGHPRPQRSLMDGKRLLQQYQQDHFVLRLRGKARKRSRICLEQATITWAAKALVGPMLRIHVLSASAHLQED
ncbi:hypothetical protein ANCDUO_02993 [Ancylostoma duodenale]|uniref:Uncharacterized protein n=1 Tax=Ancylostoma duodenale TaxID=51022 RepID=A0A0C2DAD6_9BILA|nr:hypothetical protein ANCDUO_02993 [Ancylostoma duodenale]